MLMKSDLEPVLETRLILFDIDIDFRPSNCGLTAQIDVDNDCKKSLTDAI